MKTIRGLGTKAWLARTVFTLVTLVSSSGALGAWYEWPVLDASDGALVDRFGHSVAVDDETIIVGSPDEDRGFPGFLASTGAAYIFRNEGGGHVQIEKLAPAELTGGDRFGTTVAIHGTRVIVGAPSPDDPLDNGSAYIFEEQDGVWAQVARLVDSTGAGTDRFGSAVAIYEDLAMVSAHSADSARGKILVFELDGSNWVLRGRLQPPDLAPGDFLGSAVDIVPLPFSPFLKYGAAFVAGAPGHASSAGTAYVFAAQLMVDPGWFYDKLTLPGGQVGDNFGDSVAGFFPSSAFGGILVGAPGTSSATGAVGLFLLDGDGNWNWSNTLIASDGQPGDEFGTAVAGGNPRTIVGASAAVYAFAGTTEEQKLVAATNPTGVGAYGAVVAADANDAVVGANGWNSSTGRAYVFSMDAPKPDLSVSGLSTSPGIPLVGESTTVTMTLENGGRFSAGALTSAWYEDLPVPPAIGQAGDLTAVVPGISAGEMLDLDFSWEFPAVGSYDMYGQADTTQIVDETNEANNIGGPQSVIVDPATNVEETPAPGVTLIFSELTQVGDTTVTTSATDPGPGASPFQITPGGEYYDFTTTKSYNPPVTVCLTYDDTEMTLQQELAVRLWHLEGDVWINIFSSLDTVGNQVCGTASSLSWFAAGLAPDSDEDGLADDIDNCTLEPNPNQRDTDRDGYGNLCDGDLNNDGSTNTLDLNLYKQAHRSAVGDANYNSDADFNGDDVINTLDLNIYKGLHRQPPGPSCCGVF